MRYLEFGAEPGESAFNVVLDRRAGDGEEVGHLLMGVLEAVNEYDCLALSC
jgi:hypothetical protein